MYTLTETEIEGLHYLELQSFDASSKAQICLDQGGRLSDFVFENIQILANNHSYAYKDNYASSILFPFANRIKDGKYTFNDLKYRLYCNEEDKNNALHGLVFDKTFVCIKKMVALDYTSVTLRYKNDGKCEGFPFKFNIELTYTLSKTGLNLVIKVINEDKNPFPFTLGWHPYFKSDDLNLSTIRFESDTKYVFDKQQIISGKTDLGIDMPFHLKDVTLDDCYPLNSNEIEFVTPKYRFIISSTSKENFLQLYTPNSPNLIAIEPMTGAVDSFNNGIGLQILKPNDSYSVEWDLTIKI